MQITNIFERLFGKDYCQRVCAFHVIESLHLVAFRPLDTRNFGNKIDLLAVLTRISTDNLTKKEATRYACDAEKSRPCCGSDTLASHITHC